MKHFNFYSKDRFELLLKDTSKGKKVGHYISYVSSMEELHGLKPSYVFVGLPTYPIKDLNETGFDINFEEIISTLLNIQHNQFNDGRELLVLGEIDAQSILKDISETESNSEKIKHYKRIENALLSEIISTIITSGKIPIVLGGSSPNSFSIAKGTSNALDTHINLLDISANFNLNPDALQLDESDLDEFKLNKYQVYGLHKNNVSQEEYDFIARSKRIGSHYYDDCLYLTTLDKCVKFKNAVDFLDRNLGVKLDLSCMEGFSQAASSASGFSVRDLRTFIKMLRKEHVHFFHFSDFDVTKTKSISFVLSYLISDFLRNED